jgi:hypothetical protein
MGVNMARIQVWEVSDSFWEKVEPLIPAPEHDPNKTYKRKTGGGRKPISSRKIFGAIMYLPQTIPLIKPEGVRLRLLIHGSKGSENSW